MSSLNGLGRVYDDACDLGLTLVSHKTGREIVFAMYREIRDGEGELQAEEYEPADVRQRGIARLVIFND